MAQQAPRLASRLHPAVCASRGVCCVLQVDLSPLKAEAAFVVQTLAEGFTGLGRSAAAVSQQLAQVGTQAVCFSLQSAWQSPMTCTNDTLRPARASRCPSCKGLSSVADDSRHMPRRVLAPVLLHGVELCCRK